MKRILNGRIKLLDISVFLLCCYPILKFNISSLLLIIFCGLALINSINTKGYQFTRRNLVKFSAVSFFFFLLIISISYSENTTKAVNRIVQLLPLLLIPFVILFLRPKFSTQLKIKALNVFLISNALYVAILVVVFLFNIESEGVGLEQKGFSVNYDKVQFILNSIISGDLLFVHKAYFSMGFVLISIFSLTQANTLFPNYKTKGLLYFIIFLIFSSVVIYAFSFPNIIALIACIIIFMWYELRKQTLNIRIFFIPIIVMMSFGVLVMLFNSDNPDIKRGISFVTSVIGQKDIEGNDPRIEIYKTYSSLLKKASAKDIIFGFGVGDEQELLHRELESRIRLSKNKNMLSFNEEFNSGYWFKNNLEVIPNKLKDPNGFYTADLLESKSTIGEESRNISSDVFLEYGREYNFSVHVNSLTASNFVLRLGDIENRAYFDLKQGEVMRKFEGVKNASIVGLSENWYRCSITVTGAGLANVILGILDEKGNYNHSGNSGTVSLWGAQIEQGHTPSAYIKNKSELMEYVYRENLNTHNNYLFFLITGGLSCLLAFLGSLIILFRESINNKNILQVSFCVIISLNFLTENIFSRHWGLMFVAIMAIILFTPTKIRADVEKGI